MSEDTNPLNGFEIRYHHALPDWCKVLGLDIREIPECEGGGYRIPKAKAEAIRCLPDERDRYRAALLVIYYNYHLDEKPLTADEIHGIVRTALAGAQ